MRTPPPPDDRSRCCRTRQPWPSLLWLLSRRPSAPNPTSRLALQSGRDGLLHAHCVALGSDLFERFVAQSSAGFVFGLEPHRDGVTSWTAPNLVPDAAHRAEQACCAPVRGSPASDPSQVHQDDNYRESLARVAEAGNVVITANGEETIGTQLPLSRDRLPIALPGSGDVSPEVGEPSQHGPYLRREHRTPLSSAAARLSISTASARS